MQLDRIHYIYSTVLNALLLAGICGPLFIWYHAFQENHIIFRSITFVIYCVIELLWFWYMWFIWLPVTVISIILILSIDLRYGSRLKQYELEQYELKIEQVRMDEYKENCK